MVMEPKLVEMVLNGLVRPWWPWLLSKWKLWNQIGLMVLTLCMTTMGMGGAGIGVILGIDSQMEGELIQEEKELKHSNKSRNVSFLVGLQTTPPIDEESKNAILNHMAIDKCGKVEEEYGKWENALIGYVVGGKPSFKEMLKFIYNIWNFVTTPHVYSHDEDYFVFLFDSKADKDEIMQNGPYTYNNHPMVLQNWKKDFRFNDEMLCFIPLWVIFPGLLIYYWEEENLSRIAGFTRKPICVNQLTVEVERISYGRVLIEKVTATQVNEKQNAVEQKQKGKDILVDEDESFPTLQQVYQMSPRNTSIVSNQLSSKLRREGQPHYLLTRLKHLTLY
ncbi:hypothetical protein BC332_01370 [Capsicum chinense]|nr:hypothetical protein BC332_01370 [Capsicum chinense]